jgi:hypothetical protein
MIFPLNSPAGRAERETVKRLNPDAVIYCQTGPLSVIVRP